MSDVPALTVLILCRDEENSIAHCVGEAREFLDRRAIAGEVLVLDNGSRDRSAALAEAAGARVVKEPRAGYGNAIISGIRAARGHFIILGDGDGEHDLSALDPFWEALQDGSDIVIGNRFASEGPPVGMAFLRRYVGNPILSALGGCCSRRPCAISNAGSVVFAPRACVPWGFSLPGWSAPAR